MWRQPRAARRSIGFFLLGAAKGITSTAGRRKPVEHAPVGRAARRGRHAPRSSAARHRRGVARSHCSSCPLTAGRRARGGRNGAVSARPRCAGRSSAAPCAPRSLRSVRSAGLCSGRECWHALAWTGGESLSGEGWLVGADSSVRRRSEAAPGGTSAGRSQMASCPHERSLEPSGDRTEQRRHPTVRRGHAVPAWDASGGWKTRWMPRCARRASRRRKDLMTNATCSVRCAHLAWLPAPLGAGRGQWAARRRVSCRVAGHRGARRLFP